MPQYDYDLLVIGSGPAGQRAAIQAAKLDKRVAIVERKAVVGGVCINTGTIPSKTLREAVLYFSGYRLKEIYGESYAVKQNVTMTDLLFRTDYVIRHEIDVIRHQLARNRVEILSAEASFADAHTLRLKYLDSQGYRDVTAAKIVIAVGTTATKEPHIPFDGRRILTSDDILNMDRLPRTLAVVGAGVIGLEYASLFAALGVRVTLIDKRPRLLPFVDTEIMDTLAYHLRENRVTLRLEEEVSGIEPFDDERGGGVKIHLASGKQTNAEKALYSIGRTGATSRLNLGAAGLAEDERGRLKVNEAYQTSVPEIYAVGDVIGFPSLASISMEQGRLAACHAFGVPTDSLPQLFPYGIYSIPEISMVGRNEQELTDAEVPDEVGKAQDREIARRGDVAFRWQPVGIDEMALGHAEPARIGVHHVGKPGDRAADAFCDRHRDIVGRLDQHHLQRIVDGDAGADLETHLGRILRCRVARDGEQSVQPEAACLDGA